MQQVPDEYDFRQFGAGLCLFILCLAAIGFWLTRGALADTMIVALSALGGPLGVASAFTSNGSRTGKVLGSIALVVIFVAFGRSVTTFSGHVHGGFAVMACFVGGAVAGRLASLALRPT
jgi:hypothetical protein